MNKKNWKKGIIKWRKAPSYYNLYEGMACVGNNGKLSFFTGDDKKEYKPIIIELYRQSIIADNKAISKRLRINVHFQKEFMERINSLEHNMNNITPNDLFVYIAYEGKKLDVMNYDVNIRFGFSGNASELAFDVAEEVLSYETSKGWEGKILKFIEDKFKII